MPKSSHHLKEIPAVDISSFRLKWTSYYSQPPRTQPRPHTIPPFHDYIEIMISGRGWIMKEDTWREVLPGDIIWNRPGDQTIGRSDPDNPYVCLAIILVSKKKKGHPMPRITHWADIREFSQIAREAVHFYEDKEFDRDTLRDYLIGWVFFQMRAGYYKARRRSLPAPVRTTLEYMEENFGQPCRIEDLARIADWSSAHLHDAFKRYLKATPHQWLMKRRIRAAREKLVSTKYPVKQIAAECGFSDTAAFTHAFKAAVGLPPREYREQHLSLAFSRSK